MSFSIAGGDIIAVAAGGQLTIQRAGLTRRLPLRAARVSLPGQIRSPSLMVHPRTGIVPFIDRSGLGERLQGWALSPESFGTRVLAGRGGAGKTRLAVELCNILTEREWVCGFLDFTTDGEALETLAATAAPRLVVIDYVETRVEQLFQLTTLLQTETSASTPARLLLLMRENKEASSDTWLEPLRSHSVELAALADVTEVDELQSGALSAKNAEIFTLAFNAFAAHLNLKPGVVEVIPPHIATATPLEVVLTAFRAVHGSDGPASMGTVLDDMLTHEARYWDKQARDDALAMDKRLLGRVIALATLTAAKDRSEAIAVLRSVTEFADATNERCSTIAEWAHGLYPGGTYWNPLEPDLIGEHLVARELGNDSQLAEITEAASSPRVVTVLSRLSPVRAPKASSVLAKMIDRLSPEEILLVASHISDSPNAQELARSIIHAADRARPFDDFVLRMIANVSKLPFAIRIEAVEALIERLDRGYPWRFKDWQYNKDTWANDTMLGRTLVALLETDASEMLSVLKAWLRNVRPFESLDQTSRREIAIAMMVGYPDTAQAIYDDLARTDPENFRYIARLTGERHSTLMLSIAKDWAASEENPLRSAALNAAYGVSQSRFEQERMVAIDVLRTLANISWPGRADALATVAGIEPDAPGVREAIFAAVEAHDLQLGALRGYLERNPQDVLRVLEQHTDHSGLEVALRFVYNWYPDDSEIETRALALVGLAERDRELDHLVGMVAEYALYRHYEGEEVSKERLDFALRLISLGSEIARRQMYYPLARPPANQAFEAYREKAIIAFLASSPPLEAVTSFMRDLFREEHMIEGVWPSESTVLRFLKDRSPEEVSEILLRAGRSHEKSAKLVAHMVKSGAVSAVGHLLPFVREFEAPGEVDSALEATIRSMRQG